MEDLLDVISHEPCNEYAFDTETYELNLKQISEIYAEQHLAAKAVNGTDLFPAE